VIHQGVSAPGPIADLARAVTQPSWSADSYAVAITRSDGTWTARIALKRQSGIGAELHAVVTGPHREIVERRASEGGPRPLSADIPLRPASTLDIDPHCNIPCPGEIDVSVARQPHPGRHIERLAPGGYRVAVRANRNQPGERRGTAVVEATYTPRALRIPVVLQPVGTGKSIRGTVKLGAGPPRRLDAQCFGIGGDEPVYRSADIDSSGAFELRDVGPPPCFVEVAGFVHDGDVYGGAHVEVKTLPATGIVL
jgi:hypothetical protein